MELRSHVHTRRVVSLHHVYTTSEPTLMAPLASQIFECRTENRAPRHARLQTLCVTSLLTHDTPNKYALPPNRITADLSQRTWFSGAAHTRPVSVGKCCFWRPDRPYTYTRTHPLAYLPTHVMYGLQCCTLTRPPLVRTHTSNPAFPTRGGSWNSFSLWWTCSDRVGLRGPAEGGVVGHSSICRASPHA